MRLLFFAGGKDHDKKMCDLSTVVGIDRQFSLLPPESYFVKALPIPEVYEQAETVPSITTDDIQSSDVVERFQTTTNTSYRCLNSDEVRTVSAHEESFIKSVTQQATVYEAFTQPPASSITEGCQCDSVDVETEQVAISMTRHADLSGAGIFGNGTAVGNDSVDVRSAPINQSNSDVSCHFEGESGDICCSKSDGDRSRTGEDSEAVLLANGCMPVHVTASRLSAKEESDVADVSFLPVGPVTEDVLSEDINKTLSTLGFSNDFRNNHVVANGVALGDLICNVSELSSLLSQHDENDAVFPSKPTQETSVAMSNDFPAEIVSRYFPVSDREGNSDPRTLEKNKNIILNEWSLVCDHPQVTNYDECFCDPVENEYVSDICTNVHVDSTDQMVTEICNDMFKNASSVFAKKGLQGPDSSLQNFVNDSSGKSDLITDSLELDANYLFNTEVLREEIVIMNTDFKGILGEQSKLTDCELLCDTLSEQSKSLYLDCLDCTHSLETKWKIGGKIAEKHDPYLDNKLCSLSSVEICQKTFTDDHLCNIFQTEHKCFDDKFSVVLESEQNEVGDRNTSIMPAACGKMRSQQEVFESVHIPSSDELKISTSSELSVEPTLLAATYDLETGQVCHVVSTSDTSLESNHLFGVSMKHTLSSPEDDVFESESKHINAENRILVAQCNALEMNSKNVMHCVLDVDFGHSTAKWFDVEQSEIIPEVDAGGGYCCVSDEVIETDEGLVGFVTHCMDIPCAVDDTLSCDTLNGVQLVKTQSYSTLFASQMPLDNMSVFSAQHACSCSHYIDSDSALHSALLNVSTFEPGLISAHRKVVEELKSSAILYKTNSENDCTLGSHQQHEMNCLVEDFLDDDCEAGKSLLNSESFLFEDTGKTYDQVHTPVDTVHEAQDVVEADKNKFVQGDVEYDITFGKFDDELLEVVPEDDECLDTQEFELLCLKESGLESDDEKLSDGSSDVCANLIVGTLSVSCCDLQQPLSPTPDTNEMFFVEEMCPSCTLASGDMEDGMSKSSSVFVGNYLKDVKVQLTSACLYQSDEAVCIEKIDDIQMLAVEGSMFSESENVVGNESCNVKSKFLSGDVDILPEVYETHRSQSKTTILKKQVSDDIPCVTLTEDLFEAEGVDPVRLNDDTNACVFLQGDTIMGYVVTGGTQPDVLPRSKDVEGFCNSEEVELTNVSKVESETQFESVLDVCDVGAGDIALDMHTVLHDSMTQCVDMFDLHSAMFSELHTNLEAGCDGSDVVRPVDGGLRSHACSDLMSPDESGDTSSVDSFATVIAADVCGSEHGLADEDGVDDRLSEIRSLSSSFHSDMQHLLNDIDGQYEDARQDDSSSPSSDNMHTALLFPDDSDLSFSVETTSASFHGKDADLFSYQEGEQYTIDADYSSSAESDIYDLIDRFALSVIAELSDEEQCDLTTKHTNGHAAEPEFRCDSMDQFASSPPESEPSSSSFGRVDFFRKLSNGKDDVSTSSSLLEFEKFEKHTGVSGSSSVDTSDKESFGGSYDEHKHMKHASDSSSDEKKFEYGSLDEKKLQRYKYYADRDNLSSTSSLAEFENLECRVDQHGSISSVEEVGHGLSVSNSSVPKPGSGSLSSLTEFEKLDGDVGDNLQERCGTRSMVYGCGDTFSLRPVGECERLKLNMAVGKELESEVHKIVNMLQSDCVCSHQMHASHNCDILEMPSAADDIDKDSLDGVDIKSVSDVERDSLEGDISEMALSVGCVGPLYEAQHEITSHVDVDSLAGDSVMLFSSDSLTIVNEQEPTSETCNAFLGAVGGCGLCSRCCGEYIESDRCSCEDDCDCSQDNVMHVSADSLELDEKVFGHREMLLSVESAHWSMGRSSGTMCQSAMLHTDSQKFMQVSGESVDSLDDYQRDELDDGDGILSDECHVVDSKDLTQDGRIDVSNISVYDGKDISRLNVPFNRDQVSQQNGYLQEDGNEGCKGSVFLSPSLCVSEKKVLTMAEWEAMKEKRHKAREERQSLPLQHQTPLDRHCEGTYCDDVCSITSYIYLSMLCLFFWKVSVCFFICLIFYSQLTSNIYVCSDAGFSKHLLYSVFLCAFCPVFFGCLVPSFKCMYVRVIIVNCL